MSRNGYKCNYDHGDCFGKHNDFCTVLSSPIWKDECPFYKTRAILDMEQAASRKRLLAIGCGTLLTKYSY